MLNDVQLAVRPTVPAQFAAVEMQVRLPLAS
jgi:hypothetical protein